jgi:hypothetical protein
MRTFPGIWHCFEPLDMREVAALAVDIPDLASLVRPVLDLSDPCLVISA